MIRRLVSRMWRFIRLPDPGAMPPPRRTATVVHGVDWLGRPVVEQVSLEPQPLGTFPRRLDGGPFMFPPSTPDEVTDFGDPWAGVSPAMRDTIGATIGGQR